jgi:protoporphyrinogen oxidase
VPCSEISAEWGAQRIKGLSLRGVVLHFLKKAFGGKSSDSSQSDIAQKKTETSLIEKFLYPKLGPGQLWEHVADLVFEGGGEIHFGVQVDRILVDGDQVIAVEGLNSEGERVTFSGDYFLSTMPVRDLVRALWPPAPATVAEVSEGLMYRDFITVGLLASKLAVTEKDGSLLKDNWIYVQEADVVVGRLQIFNNWSPWLVSNQEKVWIGLEYFCNETDDLWKLSDAEMSKFAIAEIAKIGILKAEDVEDSHVVHVPKTYPAYFGSYDRFDVIREYTDTLPESLIWWAGTACINTTTRTTPC